MKQLTAFSLLLLFLLALPAVSAGATLIVKDKIFKAAPQTPKKSRYIDYTMDLKGETFKLGLPADFDRTQTYGLVVYNSPLEDGIPPRQWLPVLAQRRLLLLSPVASGNMESTSRRLSLAVLGVQALQSELRVDPNRIYAAGLSGGARVASGLAFLRPDLFSGTIQCVGSNFPREVPEVKAKHDPAKEAEKYGVMRMDDEISPARVKQRVRFVILTGPGDFRYGNLLDIYNGGFKKDGYQCRLMDDPKMGHEICSAAALGEALDFIEGR